MASSVAPPSVVGPVLPGTVRGSHPAQPRPPGPMISGSLDPFLNQETSHVSPQFRVELVRWSWSAQARDRAEAAPAPAGAGGAGRPRPAVGHGVPDPDYRHVEKPARRDHPRAGR